MNILHQHSTHDLHPNKNTWTYEIIQSIQNIDENHYQHLDLISNQKENVHIKRIHPFYFNHSIINPYVVADKDQQQFKIKSILSHRGNRYEQKTMEFEVQLEPIGDNESVITWGTL